MTVEKQASSSSQPPRRLLSQEQQRQQQLRDGAGGSGQGRDMATVLRQRRPALTPSSFFFFPCSQMCHREVQTSPEQSSLPESQGQDLSLHKGKSTLMFCSWSSLSSCSTLGDTEQQSDSESHAWAIPRGSSRLSWHSASSGTSSPSTSRNATPEPPAAAALPGAGTAERLPSLTPSASRGRLETATGSTRSGPEPKVSSSSSRRLSPGELPTPLALPGAGPSERLPPITASGSSRSRLQTPTSSRASSSTAPMVSSSSSKALAPHGHPGTAQAVRAASRDMVREVLRRVCPGSQEQVPAGLSAPALSTARGSSAAAAPVSPDRRAGTGQQQRLAAALHPAAAALRVRCRLLSGTGQQQQQQQQEPAVRRRTLLSLQRKPRAGQEQQSSSSACRLSPLSTTVTLQRQPDGLGHSQLRQGLAQQPLAPILRVRCESLGRSEETGKEDTACKEEEVLRALQGSSDDQAGATREDKSSTAARNEGLLYEWLKPLVPELSQDQDPAAAVQEEPSSGPSVPDPEERQVESRSAEPAGLPEALPLAPTLHRAAEEPLQSQAPAPLSPTASQDIWFETDTFMVHSSVSLAVALEITTQEKEQDLAPRQEEAGAAKALAALEGSEPQCLLPEETQAAPPALAPPAAEDKDASESPVLAEQVGTREEECQDPSPCSPTGSQEAFLDSHQFIVGGIMRQALLVTQQHLHQATLEGSEPQCLLPEETQAAPPALAPPAAEDKDASESPVLAEQVGTREEECQDPSPCNPTGSQEAFLDSHQFIVGGIMCQALLVTQQHLQQATDSAAEETPPAAPRSTDSFLEEGAPRVAPAPAAMAPEDAAEAQLAPAKQRRPSMFRRSVRALSRALHAFSCLKAQRDD